MTEFKSLIDDQGRLYHSLQDSVYQLVEAPPLKIPIDRADKLTILRDGSALFNTHSLEVMEVSVFGVERIITGIEDLILRKTDSYILAGERVYRFLSTDDEGNSQLSGEIICEEVHFKRPIIRITTDIFSQELIVRDGRGSWSTKHLRYEEPDYNNFYADYNEYSGQSDGDDAEGFNYGSSDNSELEPWNGSHSDNSDESEGKFEESSNDSEDYITYINWEDMPLDLVEYDRGIFYHEDYLYIIIAEAEGIKIVRVRVTGLMDIKSRFLGIAILERDPDLRLTILQGEQLFYTVPSTNPDDNIVEIEGLMELDDEIGVVGFIALDSRTRTRCINGEIYEMNVAHSHRNIDDKTYYLNRIREIPTRIFKLGNRTKSARSANNLIE